MSYRQYTKCASISAFVGFTWVQYVMVGGAAVVAGYLSYILGASFVPGLLITFLSGTIAYCLWWLYNRLICLGGDVCAVGFILSVETPEDKTGLDIYDTDYSLNLVIPPTLIGAGKTEVENSMPLGYLVRKLPTLPATHLPATRCRLLPILFTNSLKAHRIPLRASW